MENAVPGQFNREMSTPAVSMQLLRAWSAPLSRGNLIETGQWDGYRRADSQFTERVDAATLAYSQCRDEIQALLDAQRAVA